MTARKVQSAWNFGHPARRSPTSTARYVFAVRPGCNIPASLDDWSRRLIAVQDCSKAQLVPAALARVAFVEPIPDPGLASASVGHCGHEALHQPSAASGLPVSDLVHADVLLTSRPPALDRPDGSVRLLYEDEGGPAVSRSSLVIMTT